jgi:uncharacterized protein (DUF2235 family)
VIKIAYRLAKRDPVRPDVEQIIFYNQGVGTGNWADKITGGATGAGLEDNIHDAYIFLVANYEPEDEIYLIGFSRGAFTARSIGGMIRKCGILKRECVREYRHAEDLYHDADTHPDDKTAVDFRASNAIRGAGFVPIQMVGVWDTVGALGIPLRGLRATNKKKFQFLDTELSGTVKFAFHALAVDEHRAPFEPTLWKYKPKPDQVVEQRWFVGVHSDVGGGYGVPRDHPPDSLSDIALEWMMASARRAGLAFDSAVTEAYPTHPVATATKHDSMTLLYRLQPALERPIGLTNEEGKPPVPDPTQLLDASVGARWDKDPKYRPKNVRDYFLRTGDPRGSNP